MHCNVFVLNRCFVILKKSLVALSRARSRPNPPKVTYDEGLEHVVYHNYSSQTLNSTTMALEKLRKELAKVNGLFTLQLQ